MDSYSNAAPKYKLSTAVFIIISNMVGTGIFNSLYFQVEPVPSMSGILILWILGGLLALSGGFAYAELAGLFPRSGGEYEYLYKIYHPSLGFAAGICTLLIGFAAPIASCAINLGNYLSPITGHMENSLPSKILGSTCILLVTIIQLFGVKVSGRFQNATTVFKIGLVIAFIVLPFIVKDYTPSGNQLTWSYQDKEVVFSGSFFSCLALLYYAYVGWNSSAYLSDDIENAKRNVPLSFFIGISIVSLMYLLLNYAFMYVCTFDEIMAGGSSIGNTVISKLFGYTTVGGAKVTNIFSVVFALALIATVNGNMVAAPRVADVMGKDFKVFSLLSSRLDNGTPHIATIVMGIFSIVFVFLTDLKSLLDYVGFSLSIFSTLAVIGVFIMRMRAPQIDRPYKTIGYPFTPLVFIITIIAMIYYSVEVLYNGSYLYSIDNRGKIIISPLSASILTIVGSMFLYYVNKWIGDLSV
jgi:APA family basic amino acid/polyamine antiporter